MEGAAGPMRVLIVDDDPVYRRILTQTLGSMADVRVVGAVADLEGARRAIEGGSVDLVTLDVVLDNASGLDLLPWLNRYHPKVLTVLLTSGAERRASQSVDAILLGASTFIRKPAGPGAPARLKEDLTRFVAGVRPPSTACRRGKSTALMLAGVREVVAVGASTGGPPVVLQFCKDLPRSLALPILVTQHMPLEHLDSFVAMLNYPGGRRAVAAREGERIAADTVVVAAGDHHLGLGRVDGALTVKLQQTPPENFCRPAVDPMFRAVAQVCGSAAVGVVMTGMGSDGAKGALALQAQNAPVVVQDESSSVVWGMPGATVQLGAASEVVPGGRLGHVVAGLVRPPIHERSQEQVQ